MKVVQINTVCNRGSTGKICVSVSHLLNEKGVENYIIYSAGKTNDPAGIKVGNVPYYKLQALKTRFFGNYGFNSIWATCRIIRHLKKIKPDVVHLHNIHGHNVNLGLLFTFLKREKIKIYWTFHDCWAFTAYCPYFTKVDCNKWMKQCNQCPQLKDSSWFFDNSKALFSRKKKLFSGLDLTIITPSQWLADLVKKSFLKDYPVQVVNNGIDLNIFKPTQSNFKKKYNIPDNKYVLLGVALGWDTRKGLDVFIELAKRLPGNHQIVLVGTDDAVDKQLPSNIISIHRTQNQKELAEIYTAADIFVNPTREENYPTVNMESIACGTPVVTFRTGGSPEILDETCGRVVDCDDVDGLEKEIINICENKPFAKEDCLKRAQFFDMNARFREYINIYERK